MNPIRPSMFRKAAAGNRLLIGRKAISRINPDRILRIQPDLKDIPLTDLLKGVRNIALLLFSYLIEALFVVCY